MNVKFSIIYGSAMPFLSLGNLVDTLYEIHTYH